MKRQRSWTVMLSAGAKEPVKQFQLSKLLFYFTISFVALLIFTLIGLGYFTSSLSNEKQELVVQLEKKSVEIEEIQRDYLALQQETLTVQRSIEEFKIFEERLSNLNLEMPIDLDTSQHDGSGGIEFPEINIPSTTISTDLLEIKEELPELIKKFEDTITRLTHYEKELRSIPTIIPADGRLNSQFGNRKDPFTRRTSFHSGIDIAAPINTPIFAAADGEVIHASRNGSYGLTVIIDHKNSYETLYAHLNQVDVEVGQHVTKGETIGGMGTTGRSTGVHLHYEIRRNGEHIDPFMYMTFHEREKSE